MKSITVKYFGTKVGIISPVILVIIQFIFKINVLYINTIGKIPFYFWLTIVLIFILFTFFNEKIKQQNLNWFYLFTAIISFIYLNSMFNWSIECCPEKYESMYDWNATKGLSWIIYIPVSLIILLIQGIIYDLATKINLKKNKN